MSCVWRTGDLLVSTAPLAATPLVVKFGGSLFSRPSWPDDLRALLAARAGARLVVVGGGPLVDGLRAIDAASRQAEGLMHELAIACMGITARLVAAELGLPLLADPGDLGDLGDRTPAASGRVAVLDAARWFAACPHGRGLPAGWQVTSDCIAARVAGDRGRLLLVKSVPPPEQPPTVVDAIAALAGTGWVDDHFPVVATGLAAVSWAAPS